MNYEWHPLSMAFRMMTAEEYADFRPDIQVNGLRDSIVLFQGKILDGRNRYKACCETGIEPHFTEFDGTEEEAAAFVESKNAHRRHLSAEERLNRVREKLKADPEKSDRAIADETKAHRKTVKKERKKLEESGDIPATETRKGKDDKKRPATQPTGTRVPVESDTESGGTNAPPETTETASQPAQVSEQAEPLKVAADAFCGRINAMTRQLDEMVRQCDELKVQPLGYEIHWLSITDSLKQIRQRLHAGRPKQPCPYCKRKGTKEGGRAACTACNGTGHVNETGYRSGCKAVGVSVEEDAA